MSTIRPMRPASPFGVARVTDRRGTSTDVTYSYGAVATSTTTGGTRIRNFIAKEWLGR